MEIHTKTRPCSGLASKGTNDDMTSIDGFGDYTRVRKLGYLPSYLKKETKPSVESELVTKYKKFKMAKKDLVERQTNLKKDFEQLCSLKEKFKQFGGRDFKIETLDLIAFRGGGDENRCGDGDHKLLRVGNQNFNFEREIQGIRGRTKDCLFYLIELISAAFKEIQANGNAELQKKIEEIFSQFEESVKTISSDQDMSMQLILDNLQLTQIPLREAGHSSSSDYYAEEIANLKKVVQNLEVQSKVLQSDVDIKNREIEYLKNKETSDINMSINKLQSEIAAQRDAINDYRNKLDKQLKLRDVFEQKISQLQDKVAKQNQEMNENAQKFQSSLCEEKEKAEELKKLLEEAKNVNPITMPQSGPSYELMPYQLTAANEDVKDLQLKISKRDKQINDLKQIINSDPNKMKHFDELLRKYEELRRYDAWKSKEIYQMKEKLAIRNDTIKNQMGTISELTTKLMAQSGKECVELEKGTDVSPLQDEQMSKFSDQERIIEKLENNKIRSNALRDSLLDRISVLVKENDDLKRQIRKFHEHFAINQFTYDEQRRKQRLTEILVKQYEK